MRTNARIYIMRADDGTLKLGHSRDPERRSKQVGRSVEIVHTTDVIEHAEKIEKLAHRVLALHGRHIKGEWFEARLSDAIAAIETAIRQAEGVELPLGGRLRLPEGIGRPAKYGEPMVQIVARLTKRELERIDRITKRRGQGDRATIIREAVAAYLGK